MNCGLCPFYHFHFSEQHGHSRECSIEVTLPQPTGGDTGCCQSPEECPFMQDKEVVVSVNGAGDIDWKVC